MYGTALSGNAMCNEVSQGILFALKNLKFRIKIVKGDHDREHEKEDRIHRSQ